MEVWHHDEGTNPYELEIQCGGVYVMPGDLVVGDVDGLVVVPQSVEEKVLEIAFKKCRANPIRFKTCNVAIN